MNTMQHIHLAKQSDEFQLAHLYEHIFYTHVDTYFRSMGRYQMVDYSCDARTFQNGLITLHIEWYDRNDFVDIEKIQGLEVEFTEAHVEAAINQLRAEKGCDYLYDSVDALIEKLTELHEKAWVNIDEGDSQPQEKKALDVVFKPDAKIEVGSKTLALEYDGEDRLLPLFRIVGGCLLNVVALDAADEYGMFIDTETLTMHDEKTLIHTLLFVEDEPETADLMNLYEDTVAEMKADGAFDRIVSMLQNPSDSSKPNPVNTYIDTGILIGLKGWQHIATKENIEQLLSKIKFKGF